MKKHALSCLVFALAWIWGGSAAHAAITLTLKTSGSTVALGGSLTLTATVSGTTNPGLTWSVNGVTNGNSTTGALTGSGLTRTYTAPPINVPNPNPVTFEIVSTADTAVSNTATATVTDSIAVTLSPASASVGLSGTQEFTATISNTTNTALKWYVNGVLNGNATQGKLTGCTTVAPRTCTYTSPPVDVPSPNPAIIEVASAADPSKFKTASLTVTDSIAVTLSPASASVGLSGTQEFTATISNTTNTARKWYVNGVLNGNATQGTLSACTTKAPLTCKYTAPPVDVPSPNPAVIKVMSAADASKYATANVTVTDSIAVTLSPASASLALGGRQVFTATIANTTNTALNWYVNGVLNGNSTQGTLTACTSAAPWECTYTAPSTIAPNPDPAVIKVASAADPSKNKTARIAVPEPVPTFTASSLSFLNQDINTTSAALEVGMTNTGTANLIISTVTISGTNASNFRKTYDDCHGTTFVPKWKCGVSVEFRPTKVGIYSASLIFTDNAPNSPQVVRLIGTGENPLVSLSAPSLNFASQPSRMSSAALGETLTNTGMGALTISTVTISGANPADFTKSTDTCTGATVAASSTCIVHLTFTPSATGSRSASLSFTDNASGSPQTVPLTGTGTVPLVGFSPPNGLSFGSKHLNTPSPSLTETITNIDTVSLTISTVTIESTNAGDFSKSADTCTGATVAPRGTCTVSVIFTPSASGERAGTLAINTSVANPAQTVSLVGLGIGPLAGVYTQRYDNGRTGQNTQETFLTPSNVTADRFGKLFRLPVDGQVYAQPLYMESVSIPGQGVHNVVFVATEHDSVYAFDADGQFTTPLWHASFINPATGVTTVPSHIAFAGTQADISGETGITSTPVIDPAGGTLYVTAKTQEATDPSCTSSCTYNYFYRLHALDITTGAEKLGGPRIISASVPGTGYDHVDGTVTFGALRQLQRPGLLLLNGTLYIGFGSHGDIDYYHGWLMAYNSNTLQPTAVFCFTPNAPVGGGDGVVPGGRGSIWGGGGGVSADAAGNLYVVTANGTFDANLGGVDYGDSVLKMQLQSGQFKVLDYFTPADQAVMDFQDLDLGSSPALILPPLPGTSLNLLATAGKDGRIWLLNRDNLGKFTKNDAGPVQVIVDGSDSLFGGLSYWNGSLYVQEVGDYLKQYTLDDGRAMSPTTSEYEYGGFPNSPPAISANGTFSGVLWLVRTDGYSGLAPAVLHAFQATDVSSEIYNSTQAPGKRDQAGPAVKFVVPTIANGKVYVGTASEVDVYGLLP